MNQRTSAFRASLVMSLCATSFMSLLISVIYHSAITSDSAKNAVLFEQEARAVRRHTAIKTTEAVSSPVTEYIRAYNFCCREATAGQQLNFTCSKKDDDWFLRLMNKYPLVSSGKAVLYWAHMRKAAGSAFGYSIESYIFNHTEEPGATFTRGFVRTVKVHLRAGSRHCVDHPFANETLFVTVLRDPVDRYISEYFYTNVPIYLNSTATRDRVFEWSNRSKDNAGIKMDQARTNFVENWQTRWYTHPDDCKDLSRPQPRPSFEKYHYGSAGHGLDPRQIITRKDLEDAKTVIDNFDIVGVAPFFEKENSIMPWLELAGSNKATQVSNEVMNERVWNPEIVEFNDVMSNVTFYLYDQYKYDVELFQFAQEINIRRTAISHCVTKNTDFRH